MTHTIKRKLNLVGQPERQQKQHKTARHRNEADADGNGSPSLVTPQQPEIKQEPQLEPQVESQQEKDIQAGPAKDAESEDISVQTQQVSELEQQLSKQEQEVASLQAQLEKMQQELHHPRHR